MVCPRLSSRGVAGIFRKYNLMFRLIINNTRKITRTRRGKCERIFRLCINVPWKRWIPKLLFLLLLYTTYRNVQNSWTHSNTQGSKKLLTIFTTFIDIPSRNFMQENVIVNWASFGDLIQPILFANLSEKSKLTSLARENGWIVLPMQRTNPNAAPYFKDMYRKAVSSAKSHFYGFCNGDILYDNSLVDTLKAVLGNLQHLNRTSLVIGRRTNVDVKKVQNQTAFRDSEKLSSIARKHGELFITRAQDFFFMSFPKRFPWQTIKDIVIGRPLYDNYLVAQALVNKVSVVDSTPTLLALHQTGSDGNYAGHKHQGRDFNLEVIGRSYKFYIGDTNNAQYQTELDPGGQVFLFKRRRPKPPAKVEVKKVQGNSDAKPKEKTQSKAAPVPVKKVTRPKGKVESKVIPLPYKKVK